MRSYSFSFSHRSSMTGSVRGRLAFMEKAVFGRLIVCFRSTSFESIFGVTTMLAALKLSLPPRMRLGARDTKVEGAQLLVVWDRGRDTGFPAPHARTRAGAH